MKKHGRKSAGKKVSAKTRSNPVKAHSTRRGDGSKTSRRESTKHSKSVSKVTKSRSVRMAKVYTDRSGKATKGVERETRVTGTTKVSHGKTKQTISVSFKGVRDIGKKAALFEKSSKVDAAIAKQLKRKGGKPPRGFVIKVTDKDGRVAGDVSHPSVAVNHGNIRKATNKFVKQLTKDYTKYQQQLAEQKKRHKLPPKPRRKKGESKRKFNRRNQEWENRTAEILLEGVDSKAGPESTYKDYNPNKISKIEIVFIYPTKK